MKYNMHNLPSPRLLGLLKIKPEQIEQIKTNVKVVDWLASLLVSDFVVPSEIQHATYTSRLEMNPQEVRKIMNEEKANEERHVFIVSTALENEERIEIASLMTHVIQERLKEKRALSLQLLSNYINPS
jgi:ABC-type Fe3+/spermidine/putrescine transport system ATPase subunit